jgi:uncharacterized protein (DUF1330 family)
MIDALYGVNVVDEDLYAAYRAQMTPILAEFGGRFVVDVRVHEVLRSPAPQPFNRLFTIRFPSLAQLEAFFGDPRYLDVRKRLFVPSTDGVADLGKSTPIG